MKVAVIDNGIDASQMNIEIADKIFVDSSGRCITEDKDMSGASFTHGTLCAYIIPKKRDKC